MKNKKVIRHIGQLTINSNDRFNDVWITTTNLKNDIHKLEQENKELKAMLDHALFRLDSTELRILTINDKLKIKTEANVAVENYD
jgi:hypothetical protein